MTQVWPATIGLQGSFGLFQRSTAWGCRNCYWISRQKSTQTNNWMSSSMNESSPLRRRHPPIIPSLDAYNVRLNGGVALVSYSCNFFTSFFQQVLRRWALRLLFLRVLTALSGLLIKRHCIFAWLLPAGTCKVRYLKLFHRWVVHHDRDNHISLLSMSVAFSILLNYGCGILSLPPVLLVFPHLTGKSRVNTFPLNPQ